jgi:hypothetical protein
MLITTQEEARDAAHVEGVRFQCCECDGVFPAHTSGGTGYGYDERNKPICYACCGELDRKALDALEVGEYWTAYVTPVDVNGATRYKVSNWPGSISLVGFGQRKRYGGGLGVDRVDVWFKFNGKNFWGVNRGDNQILRVRRVKD